MLHGLSPSTSLTDETYRGRENALSSLPCLHRPCEKAPARSDALDGVKNGDGGIARKNEIAVHAMGKEDCVPILRGRLRDSQLGCRETLGYDCSTIDSASAGRMPQFARDISTCIIRKALNNGTVCLYRDPVLRSAMQKVSRSRVRPTGAMMDKEVNSRTFSMGAFEASTGFGGTSVGPGMTGRLLKVV